MPVGTIVAVRAVVIGPSPIIIVEIKWRVRRRISIGGRGDHGDRWFPADLFHGFTHDSSVLPDSLGYFAAISPLIHRRRDSLNG
jgi:hypothetical protein